MQGCSIRALWVLNQAHNVVFSRRFPTVERRWQTACKRQNLIDDGAAAKLLVGLPTDAQVVEAVANRKLREGSIQGRGLRDGDSVEGSDSWVDDPITRYIISLQISSLDEGSSTALLWPLVLHRKGNFYLLVLPLVEPRHLTAYRDICWRSNCGSPHKLRKDGQEYRGLSSMLFELPGITGAFVVAKSIGNLITGDANEPEVFLSTTPSGGGLLDTLTVGIGITGITARAKPAGTGAAPAVAATSGTATSASVAAGRISLKAADKDTLRNFISSSMPFGTPLHMSPTTIASMRSIGFSAADVPPTDQTQPAWKPYLYKGKPRILFTVSEVVNAALYDRDDVPDAVSLAGQVNCRAELEGLPDVSVPITFPSSTKFESFTYHPCCQAHAFEQGHDRQTVMFSPPLGNFVLIQYLAVHSKMPPPVKGFYQLSMVSENEGAILFKLRLMEGYKAPYVMEHCTITMPFPRRKILSLDGNPSLGTVSTFENSVEWKLVISARGLSKSTEVTFTGTITFGQMIESKAPNSSRITLDDYNEEFDSESELVSNKNTSNNTLQEMMTKEDIHLAAVELEEPFCWEAYGYAKASFRLVGSSMSGLTVDSKSVGIYPAVKVPCEVSAQVMSGDYILWNSLGRYPHVDSPKA